MRARPGCECGQRAKAIAALQRHGIDRGLPRSRAWNGISGQAGDEACPLYPGKSSVLHWSTPDRKRRDRAFDAVYWPLRNRIETKLQ